MLPVVAFLLVVAVSADTVKHVKFEEDADLYCQVPLSYQRDVLWIRNGRDVCTPNSTWCAVNGTPVDYVKAVPLSYRSHLRVRSVITNGTYTCEAVTKDGRTIVSKNKVVVVPDYLVSRITPGMDYTITCDVKTPNLHLRLFSDDQVPSCRPEGCSAIHGTIGSGSAMKFKLTNVQANHTYTCVAYSGMEKLATVWFHQIIPVGYVSKVKHVKFEEDANLYCIVSPSGLRDVRWIRNGRDVCTPNSTWCAVNRTVIIDDEEAGSVSFRSHLRVLRMITDGTYTCEAVTKDGRTWIVSENKVVVVPDYLVSRITPGKDFTITCDVKTPNLHLRLFRDDQVPCTPEWCSAIPGTIGSTMKFELTNVQANHTYACVAFSGKEKLATVWSHQIIPVGYVSKVQHVRFEEDANLYCIVSPSGVRDVLWFRNGRDVCTPSSAWCAVNGTVDIDDEVGSVSYRSHLRVLSVIRNGTYTCEAVNKRSGSTWIVSENKVVVVGRETDGMPSPGTSWPSREPTPEPPTDNPVPRGRHFY